METHWIFSGCDEADETAVAQYWDERLLELEGKLNALADGPSELHVGVHHDDGRPAWEVQLALHLPGTTLAAENAGDRLPDVLDGAVCELARRMDEHDERDAAAAGTPAWVGLDAVAGLLRRSHARGRSDAFFAVLEPMLRSLTGHLRLGLGAPESDDAVAGDDVTLDDVHDEALSQAWERFGEFTRLAPPDDRRFDAWLREVVAEALRQSNHRLAERSLDEESPEPVDDADDPLREAWSEPGGYPQTVELADSIAGHPGVDAWDRLSDDPAKSDLIESLGKLPRDQRQALLLSLVEGFSPEQIADFQGRSPGDVQDDIELAQQTLRRELDEASLETLERRLAAERRPGRGRR